MPITLQKNDVKDSLTVAAEIAAQLSVHAVSRDAEAGIPTEEVALLKRSGLLLLPIPGEYGGAGARWTEIYPVIQALAKAQGSLGQLYANHVVLVILGEVIGRPEQAEQFYRLTAQQNLFWANALNARDARLTIAPEGDHFRVNGVKSFGTGVAVADMNAIGAVQEGTNTPVVFVIPQERAGVRYNKDWDNLGQRRTVSGSYTFENVLVTPDELVGPPPVAESIFPTLVFLMSQLGKIFTYLGIAEGALAAAKDYTTTSTRAWINSGVETAAQDPFILHRYGEFWAELQAAIALANQAAEQIQIGWDKKLDLTVAERGEIAIAVSAAKVVAIKTGLNITNHIFDVMGARATATCYGFDRFWRDLRTFSLHDPVDYKCKEIGNWFLNQEYPTPSQYS
ncbi:MAG: acyl-CoA dehydrogenase family protein [Scytolyngbya sp. HA4215-MV1]|jgi:alkylation response protein AidB-like acyl-CoA dehydrogenase|nr:acyl-CoA dehydrogenase family protein [Scytolyngbya sp. HA4215-MV1]